MESSRTSLASRTHFEVLGLKDQVFGLGLHASSPRKLACPRLEDSTFFEWLKFCRSPQKKFYKTFFFWRSPEKNFEDLFFDNTCTCVLGPWPRAFLSLASRGSVLGRAVLGLGLQFFLCPLPWPRALCPQLHLWLGTRAFADALCSCSAST